MNIASKNWMKEHLRKEIEHTAKQRDMYVRILAWGENHLENQLKALAVAEKAKSADVAYKKLTAGYTRQSNDRDKQYIEKLSFDLYSAKKILRAL